MVRHGAHQCGLSVIPIEPSWSSRGKELPLALCAESGSSDNYVMPRKLLQHPYLIPGVFGDPDCRMGFVGLELHRLDES